MLHENTELTIYLIRHGESEANLRADSFGNKLTPLTKKGQRQAIRLGKLLKKEGVIFDKVYSSPLPRSLQTCQLVVGELGYPFDQVVQVQALEEIDAGIWEGKIRDDVLTPEIALRMSRKGDLFAPVNGESWRMVRRRIANWFDDEILYNPAYLTKRQTLGVFGHATADKLLLQDLINFDTAFLNKMHFGNTGYIKLFLNKDGISIHKFISHP
ncbi:histidine phosphatase family protein [Candidatus Daviesbacteria bacterium]|nr:histidine phosphatase family protein [Candidatus Daviesbacteria bacterium]